MEVALERPIDQAPVRKVDCADRQLCDIPIPYGISTAAGIPRVASAPTGSQIESSSGSPRCHGDPCHECSGQAPSSHAHRSIAARQGCIGVSISVSLEGGISAAKSCIPHPLGDVSRRATYRGAPVQVRYGMGASRADGAGVALPLSAQPYYASFRSLPVLQRLVSYVLNLYSSRLQRSEARTWGMSSCASRYRRKVRRVRMIRISWQGRLLSRLERRCGLGQWRVEAARYARCVA